MPLIPSWLWLWLSLFIWNLPAMLTHYHENVKQGLESSNKEVYGTSLAPLLESPTILELVPLFALSLGIAVVFLPHLRARWVEKKFQLEDDAPLVPAVLEIKDFIRQYAPKLRVKVNPLCREGAAFVYPISYRESAIAILNPLVRMWRGNRPAAEAVLLHEIAHDRHGDALLVGAGSLLEYVLRYWWKFALAFLVIPILIVWLGMSIQSITEWHQFEAEINRQFDTLSNEMKELGLPPPEMPKSTVLDLFIFENKQFFTLVLPTILVIAFETIIWMAAMFIVPILAIWCTEFNADRYAMEIEKTTGSLVSALEISRRKESPWHWLLRRISHPPVAVRLAVARRSKMVWVVMLLLLVFPAAYMFRLVFLLVWGTVVALSSGINISVVDWVSTFMEQFMVPALLIATMLAIWPFAASAWMHWRRGGRQYWDIRLYSAYVVVAGVVIGLAVMGYCTCIS